MELGGENDFSFTSWSIPFWFGQMRFGNPNIARLVCSFVFLCNWSVPLIDNEPWYQPAHLPPPTFWCCYACAENIICCVKCLTACVCVCWHLFRAFHWLCISNSKFLTYQTRCVVWRCTSTMFWPICWSVGKAISFGEQFADAICNLPVLLCYKNPICKQLGTSCIEHT